MWRPELHPQKTTPTDTLIQDFYETYFIPSRQTTALIGRIQCEKGSFCIVHADHASTRVSAVYSFRAGVHLLHFSLLKCTSQLGLSCTLLESLPFLLLQTQLHCEGKYCTFYSMMFLFCFTTQLYLVLYAKPMIMIKYKNLDRIHYPSAVLRKVLHVDELIIIIP